MPIVLKSGSLSLLEPSGPLQVCDGIVCFYCEPTKNNDMGGTCDTGERRDVCRVLLGRPKEKDHLEDLDRWKDINLNLQEVGWRGMDLIDLAQDRDGWRALMKAVVNLRVP